MVETRQDYNRDYRVANRDRLRQRAREYYLAHQEELRVYRHRYHQTRRRLLRAEVLRHYGGDPPRCVCCGEREDRFLTVDHIDGPVLDQERKCRRWNRQGGSPMFYQALKEAGYPAGVQILCWNCNCGRALNGGVCPHKER